MKRNKIGFWSQVGITYFVVSGGPYGLESAVGAIGPSRTLLLLLIIPLIWALPTNLMVAELSSMMPLRGGYYTWVKKAMGPFWGFQEGWWTLCYSAVDLAIYPVLFVTYLSYFFPNLQNSPWQWPLSALFALAGFFANLRHSMRIGKEKIWEASIVFIPFALIILFGFFQGSWDIPNLLFSDWTESKKLSSFHIGLAEGLAILIWNFSGWDNVSTYADEVDNAAKNIPLSQFVCLGLVVLTYLFPLIAGLKVAPQPAEWIQGSGWPDIAAKLGGNWLGIFTAAAAIVSVWALFNSQLLYIARIPAAMAEEKMLPQIFAKRTQQHQVPWFSLVCAATAAALFSGFSLGKLMILDILLYSLGLSLEYVSLILLRIKKPHEPRPFKIPFANWGLVVMSLLPLSLALVIAFSSFQGESGSYFQIGLTLLAIGLGVLVYKFKDKLQDSK